MSDARARRIIAACAITLIGSHAARAQTVAEYAKRVDSLTRIWRVAVVDEARADSERVSRLPTDTIRVGNFVILSDPEHVQLAKATAAIISPELDRGYGAWASRMHAHMLVLRQPRQGPTTADGQPVVESGVAGPGGRVLMPSTSIATTDALGSAWLQKAEQFLSDDLDPDLRDWLGITLTSEPATARTLAQGRVELVLARSRVAHDCALGKHDACMQALGLVAVDDVPFTLFDATQRRGMIEWYSFVLQRRDPSAYSRCVQGGSDATCDSLVRSIPPEAVPKPVPGAVKKNLVRYALLLGGDGAFDRLAKSAGPISDRIAATARMPIDSVVSRWQSNVMSSQSSSTAIDATTALSSLFWACLCGALALRSSRWR
jgi:hypothetical protein